MAFIEAWLAIAVCVGVMCGRDFFSGFRFTMALPLFILYLVLWSLGIMLMWFVYEVVMPAAEIVSGDIHGAF